MIIALVKQMKKTFAIVSSILIVTALLLGCVGQDKDSTKKMTELKIGYQPSTHQIAEMVAMEKGWWLNDLKKFGIEMFLNKFSTLPLLRKSAITLNKPY